MATARECMEKLEDLAKDLDERSEQLHTVERALEPIEEQYRQHVDSYEIALWQRSQDEEGFKLPSESMRLKLAHRDIDQALYGRYVGLVKARKRLEQRLRDIKAEVEAWRSILSALKVEMEATAHR